MQPRRQLDVRYQGVLAACLSLALVAVVALVGLRYFSDPESAPHNLTPTSIAAITPAPVEATPDVLPSPGNLPAASPTAAAGPPPLQERDKWGQVIEVITEDPDVSVFRSSISRSGVYDGDAIRRRPSVAWSVSLGDENFSVAAVQGGQVLIGGNDGTLKSLDAETGESVWQFEARDDISSSPAVGGNRVYFGSFDGNFYAIDIDNGRRRWRFETADAIHSSPAIDGSIVYFGGYDRVVYALSMLDGTLVWAAPTGDRIQSSPAISGDLVIIGSDDGYVYALDRLTGKRRWRVDTGAAVTSTPAIAEEMVYVASTNGRIMGLRIEDGEIDWTYDAESAISFSSPAVDNNTVVIGTDAGQLLGLRGDNGRERWIFSAEAEIRASPIIVDDIIYVGSYDENLYAIDLKTGERVWSTDRGGQVGSPVYADGTIYISLNSGELMALRPED